MILIGAVAAGALLGYAIGPKAGALRPLGDVFLNLLLTAVERSVLRFCAA